MKYIFIYGSEGHPYVGGWTEVEAPDMSAAVLAFRAIHPNRDGDCLNCCGIYAEEQFRRTQMAGPKGNLGAHCHERIILAQEVLNG